MVTSSTLAWNGRGRYAAQWLVAPVMTPARSEAKRQKASHYADVVIVGPLRGGLLQM
jgi:hypothetical protein